MKWHFDSGIAAEGTPAAGPESPFNVMREEFAGFINSGIDTWHAMAQAISGYCRLMLWI